MKRLTVLAITAALALTGIAIAASTNFDGHDPNDDPVFVDFTRGGGKVQNFNAYKLKYGPAFDRDCDQSGRTVYRVRVGPFDRRDEADTAKDKLENNGVESSLVRVQR